MQPRRLVANWSTIIFEPHSERESFLRALVTMPGLSGLRRKTPTYLWYRMHNGLGCIVNLASFCRYHTSTRVLFSSHFVHSLRLKRTRNVDHKPCDRANRCRQKIYPTNIPKDCGSKNILSVMPKSNTYTGRDGGGGPVSVLPKS